MAFINQDGPAGTAAQMRASKVYTAPAAPKPIPADPMPPGLDMPRGVAHTLSSLGRTVSHLDRHLTAAQEAEPGSESQGYNLAHAAGHTKESQQYVAKLAGKLGELNPAITEELGKMQDPTQLSAQDEPESGPEETDASSGGDQ